MNMRILLMWVYTPPFKSVWSDPQQQEFVPCISYLFLKMQKECDKDVRIGVSNEEQGNNKLKKTSFDVLGICCPSEVPLIEKILKPLAGVESVLVNVPSRTVTVVHDPVTISSAQIGIHLISHFFPMKFCWLWLSINSLLFWFYN